MTWNLTIENVAGIREGSATVTPGVNAVTATNWQGKSSFVAAIETAVGTDYTLTEGTDRGGVHLETPDRTLDVELVREGDAVVRRGEPLLTDEYDVIRADLYACLDERNPVRRAVRNGENLEAVLTRPLDFENIDERIANLEAERERIDTELAQAREAAKRLPTVQERIYDLEAEVEDLHGKLDAVSTTEDADVREELSTVRAERDRVKSRIDRLEATVDRTESTLAEKRDELSDLAPPDAESVEAELADARDRLTAVERDVEVLQSLYSANQAVLKEDRVDLVADVERELSGDRLTCWVCGQETLREDLEQRVEALGDRVRDRRATVETHRDRVEELEARREKRLQARRRRETLETAIRDLEETLSDRQGSLSSARDRAAELADRIEDFEDAVEDAVDEATDVESEIKYREAELEDARDELATLETRADRRDALESQRSELSEELQSLRGRKETVKRRARESFDRAIDDVLARFDTGFETARLTSTFDLVVARDGREASLDALSEGELELLGFVAVLAGHEAFEVGDRVPILLVDDVTSLAEDNLQELVTYIAERAEYVVFTAHTDGENADHHAIDPGDWSVVSDDSPSTGTPSTR